MSGIATLCEATNGRSNVTMKTKIPKTMDLFHTKKWKDDWTACGAVILRYRRRGAQVNPFGKMRLVGHEARGVGTCLLLIGRIDDGSDCLSDSINLTLLVDTESKEMSFSRTVAHNHRDMT